MKKILYIATFMLSFILADSAFALNPIARTDVVPYQRIGHGQSFNFGVVAFSKEGIDRVEFLISGQGYSGGVKTASQMRLNTRLAHTEPMVKKASWPGVWEYYVSVSSSEFSSNGQISITPTVYGSDGGVRILEAVPMIVEATGPIPRKESWVDPGNGNDTTGEVGNENMPFLTINAAIQAAQSANGGTSDGNIIYLENGTYDLSGDVPITETEWLTIKSSDTASRDEVIFDNGGNIKNTGLIKFDSVTFYTDRERNTFLTITNDNDIWLHNSKITSNSRYFADTICGDPCVHPVGSISYATNVYAYDIDRPIGNTKILRNFSVHKISEDLARNSNFLVNIRLDDQDNGNQEPGCWHSDGYQNFLRDMNNEIIYNYYGTNMHYQGLFIRVTNAPNGGNDVAFVNIFMEMREPANGGRSNGVDCSSPGGLTNGAIYFDSNASNHWNHLLLWQSSFPSAHFSMYMPSDENALTNSSISGNIFYELRDSGAAGAWNEPSAWSYNNIENNDFLYNHYKASFLDLEDCGGAPPQPAGCPGYHAKSSDTSENHDTSSIGLTGLERFHPQVLDRSDTTNYNNFGVPLSDSGLIDRLPYTLVPADVFGNTRDTRPDIGAIEYQNGNTPIIIRSDVDQNNITNSIDSLLILRKSLSLSVSATAWQDSASTGDVNCDGVTNSTDALLTLKYSLGLNMSSTSWCDN